MKLQLYSFPNIYKTKSKKIFKNEKETMLWDNWIVYIWASVAGLNSHYLHHIIYIEWYLKLSDSCTCNEIKPQCQSPLTYYITVRGLNAQPFIYFSLFFSFHIAWNFKVHTSKYSHPIHRDIACISANQENEYTYPLNSLRVFEIRAIEISWFCWCG